MKKSNLDEQSHISVACRQNAELPKRLPAILIMSNHLEVRSGNVDLTIKSSGFKEPRVETFQDVGGRQDDDVAGVQPVHLLQKLHKKLNKIPSKEGSKDVGKQLQRISKRNIFISKWSSFFIRPIVNVSN